MKRALPRSALLAVAATAVFPLSYTLDSTCGIRAIPLSWPTNCSLSFRCAGESSLGRHTLEARGSRQKVVPVTYLRRMFAIPATESQMAVGLGLSLVMMSLMLWGLLWQSEIIVYQRTVIKFLFNYH